MDGSAPTTPTPTPTPAPAATTADSTTTEPTTASVEAPATQPTTTEPTTGGEATAAESTTSEETAPAQTTAAAPTTQETLSNMRNSIHLFGTRFQSFVSTTTAQARVAVQSTTAQARVAVQSTTQQAREAISSLATPRAPHPPYIRQPLCLLGTGGVGRALLEAILQARAVHATNYGVFFHIVGVGDSSGVLDTSQLSDEALIALLHFKTHPTRAAAAKSDTTNADNTNDDEKPPQQHNPRGRVVDFVPNDEELCGPFVLPVEGEEHAALLVRVIKRLPKSTIVVDCTASEGTARALVECVELGHKAVLANKKPLCLKQDVFDYLITHGLSRFRYESTVVAAVPVIASVTRATAADDRITKISGTFSGTLGFVMSGLEDGHTFSKVVVEAKALGYTEPDPRDDLGGVDVARKALILARSIGCKIDMSQVQLTPLFPEEWSSLSVEEFMAKLPELDDEMKSKAQQAKSEGAVLRYVGEVEGDKVVVGLKSVPLDSPLGRARGCANLVEIRSKWNNETPLVLQGPGAGTGTTAAGVLSDIMELCFTRT